MDVKFRLVDAVNGSPLVHEGTVVIRNSSIEIKFDSLVNNDTDVGDGIPVVFEVWNGELRHVQYCFEGGEWVEQPIITPLLPPE